MTLTPLVLTFDVERRITGVAGCNRYFAAYNTSGSQLEIDTIGSTRKRCPPPRNAAEQRYLKALDAVERWRIDGEDLVLTTVSSATTIRLQPIEK